MADITASVKVSGQNQNPQSGIPYLSTALNSQMGSFLRDIFKQGRYITPSAITIDEGLITIPAGTVVYLEEGDGIYRFEFVSPATITVDEINIKVWLRVGTTDDGRNRKVLLLEVGTVTPSGALEIGTASEESPPTTLTFNEDLDKTLPRLLGA